MFRNQSVCESKSVIGFKFRLTYSLAEKEVNNQCPLSRTSYWTWISSPINNEPVNSGSESHQQFFITPHTISLSPFGKPSIQTKFKIPKLSDFTVKTGQSSPYSSKKWILIPSFLGEILKSCRAMSHDIKMAFKNKNERTKN